VRPLLQDFDCGGKVLRLKRYIPPGASPQMLNLLIDALAHNLHVEVLYIQNFEHGFFDKQLERLTEVLKLRRIWGLNVGENFGVSLKVSSGNESACALVYGKRHEGCTRTA
jgi:hypothetical protein